MPLLMRGTLTTWCFWSPDPQLCEPFWRLPFVCRRFYHIERFEVFRYQEGDIVSFDNAMMNSTRQHVATEKSGDRENCRDRDHTLCLS